jgi:acetylcholinesterase
MNIYVFIISVITLTKETIQQGIPTSIDVNSNRDKIYLRLENNQILIGNRKQVNFNYQNGDTQTKIVYEFLSLPFAEPPVGTRRFKYAFKLRNTLSTNVYNATYPRSACMQARVGWFGETKLKLGEDCLYFSLWVPVTKDQDDLLYFKNSKLYYNNLNKLKYIKNGFIYRKSGREDRKTTMFWIHGGGYVTGSANEAAYDGTVLSSTENVIVAGTNYRLGVFGYLFLNDSRVPGNIAAMDQLMAIEWFKEKHVNFFGGLDDNICLFGESAGAESIINLMFSKKNYLFNRVILESPYNVSHRTPSEVYARSINYLKLTGCVGANFDIYKDKITNSNFDCLMKADADLLIDKQSTTTWFLTSNFVNTKQILDLDILFGFNQNEISIFLYFIFGGRYFDYKDQDLDNFDSDSTKYNNSFVVDRLADSLYQLPRSYLTCVNNFYTLNNKSVFLNDFYNGTVDYNLDSPANLKLNSRRKAWDKISKIASDLVFNCPALYLKNATKTNGKIYQYKFNKKGSFNIFPRWLGVTHTEEIPFVFGTPFILSNSQPIDSSDRLLSSFMMNYWANFAKSGV